MSTFEEYWKDKGSGGVTVSLKTIWEDAQAECARRCMEIITDSDTPFTDIEKEFLNDN